MTDAQSLLTKPAQPAEMLFNVKDDPHQFNNLVDASEHAVTLRQMRELLDRWKNETGDSVPDSPTEDRQPLHEKRDGRVKRGDMPGEANNATLINAPGPIHVEQAASLQNEGQDNRRLAARTTKPNVIVILADDLGFSDLGCYGSEIPTPHLDALAAGGARFSSFYTSARCCPSRASLITGLHPHQAGIGSFANRNPQKGWGPAYTGHLLPNCVTLAEVLGDAGYSTWMVGKWHMGTPGPIQRGFQNYYGYKNFLAYAENQWDADAYVRLPESKKPELSFDKDFYATDVFGRYAIEFMRQARRQDKPYFLYLAHSSPHFPVQAPKESIDRHVESVARGWDELRKARFEKQKQLGLIASDAELPPRSEVPVDKESITNGYGGQPNPAWDALDSQRQTDLARRGATFAAMVEHVDQGVGKIIDDLRANDELDNTLILFLSDNGACYEWGPFGFDGPSRNGITTLHTGELLNGFGQDGTNSSYGSGWANLGNTPLNMYKHFCHEGGIASPLILHWPSGVEKRVDWVRTPTHLMDVVPTVLDAAGVEYPKHRLGQEVTPTEGVSMLPMVRGETTDERDLAFEHQSARGLRRSKWKIVWGKRQPTDPTWELYDLQADRSEQNDLAGEHPELVSELVAAWEAWAKRVGAAPFQKPDDPSLSGPIEGQNSTPMIANVSITVEATVNGDRLHGVILAQGGREQGYALHVIDGKPAFDVRINGKVTRVASDESVSGTVRLHASLTKNRLTLKVGDGQAIVRRSRGLIPKQPQDGLSISYDDRTAAGDYQAPGRFSGKVLKHSVRTR